MCNCEGKKYSISMGCCQPVLAPIENYYTKYQIDEMLEEIESGITSGCCITEEEVDEKISAATSGLQETLVAGDNIVISGNVISAEVPSLSGYATEQWVLNNNYIADEALQDYYTKSDVNNLIGDMATKTWIANQGFALYATMMQYIDNLQNQIDSLIEVISGCCSSSGETIYRWITMTGDNDYTCSGTSKMTKEKQQSSTDNGITWSDTGQYRTGDTVLEENCIECGYVPPLSNLKYKGDYTNGQSKEVECNGVPSLTISEIQNNTPMSMTGLTSVTIGACCSYMPNDAFAQANHLKTAVMEEGVLSTGQGAFSNCTELTTVIIPNSVMYIDSYSFAECTSLSALTMGSGITEIGIGAFSGCSSMTNDISLPNITEIYASAFVGCSNIQSVTIGSGITSIASSAFLSCSSLTSVTVEAVTPPTLHAHAFDSTNNCPIYVPRESVEQYKAKYIWSDYADRIQAIP